GMVRVSDPDIALRVAKTLERLRAVFYVQRAVETGGRDIRAFVVGGRVIGAIERSAPAGEWRTNVSRGGRARALEIPVEFERLAVRAAAAVGADYAGVDLLPSRSGEVFVAEVNGIPGWRGLAAATGIDVAAVIVDHLVARVQGAARAGGRGGIPAGCGRTGRLHDALRVELRDVVESTTVDDARQAYAAIRRAAPGGLGRVESQDVRDEPDVTLVAAMRLAADR